MEKALTTVRVLPAALVLILFGVLVSRGGRSVILEWHAIGSALAACGAIWILAGPAMFVAGCWVLGVGGRRQIPLWVGGVASVVAGATLIAGVLAQVIPCTGSS
jgi:hypothetical protein